MPDLVAAVQDYVSRSLTPIVRHFAERMAVFSVRLEAGEALMKSHADGLNACRREIDAVHMPEVEAIATRAAQLVPMPKNGRDADHDAIVDALVARIGIPQDGTDGKDGRDAPALDEIVRAVLAAMPQPKDGQDGRDAPPLDEIVRAIAAVIPVPKDGEPGRDGAGLEILGAIDPTRIYARGTYATHAGGLVHAVRPTSPLGDDLFAAGWQVITNGLAGISIEHVGERGIVIRCTMTDGRSVPAEISLPVMLYRGVYREDQQYQQGDAVTFGGGIWVARGKPTGKPTVAPEWQLAVKPGRDGKDRDR